MIGELGKGSFGTVRRATAEGRDDVAIKCISKRRMRREGAFAKGKKKKNSGLAGLKWVPLGTAPRSPFPSDPPASFVF